jgi:hypothetical protein
MRRKKIKYGSPYFQGRVLQIRKWKRINDCPLHMNLKIIVLQIRHDLLENSRIIRVEKKHNCINNQEFFFKIKNGYYQIFPSIILEGGFWGIRGDQRNINIPWDVNKNKVHLVLKIDLHTNGKR